MIHAEFQSLATALRKILKARKLKYSDLAKRLRVSEVTVKRFFSSSDSSLGRIVEICQALDISFPDLVAQAKGERESTFTLTEKQEEFLAKHEDHHQFLEELVSGKLSPQEIQAKHKLSAASLAKYLRDLEKAGLLDWLPGDRVALKVSGTHNWLDEGALVKKFLRADNRQFLDHMHENFQHELHFLTTSDRRMHPDTLKGLIGELKLFFSSFRKRVYRDEVFCAPEELVHTKWLFGIAPFEKSWPRKIQNR